MKFLYLSRALTLSQLNLTRDYPKTVFIGIHVILSVQLSTLLGSNCVVASSCWHHENITIS